MADNIVFWLLTPLFLCWPAHRAEAREALSETLLGWALRVAPAGPAKIRLATFLLMTLNDNSRLREAEISLEKLQQLWAEKLAEARKIHGR